MPESVCVEGPQQRREVVNFQHDRTKGKDHEQNHLPNVLALTNLRQAPSDPSNSTLKCNKRIFKFREESSNSTSYQNPRANVNFHVVRVIECIVAEVNEVVEEEQHEKQCYKAGQLLGFAMDHSELRSGFLLVWMKWH